MAYIETMSEPQNDYIIRPDPADARRFVLDLPVSDAYGHGGLPLSLVSAKGVQGLANSALAGARGPCPGE